MGQRLALRAGLLYPVVATTGREAQRPDVKREVAFLILAPMHVPTLAEGGLRLTVLLAIWGQSNFHEHCPLLQIPAL